MSEQEHWLVIGRFGRPHGVKGFITLYSFTEPYENILSYNDWHACINHSWQPIKVLSVQTNNKSIIAQIDGYPERELVARLTNVEIAIQKKQLAPLNPGEYYWHQLTGMKVINQQGQCFGYVTEIMPTGANDVLVVQGEKKYLIPYLPGLFVIDINDVDKVITVDWDMDF